MPASAPTPAPLLQEPAWTDPLLANPHAVSDKAARVNKMFSAIAPSYDLNNRLHSMWMDQHWRSVAVKMAQVKPTDTIVDVACGTGDLTLKFAKKLHQERATAKTPLAPANVFGIDFTYAMLPIARQKASQLHSRNSKLMAPDFIQGDALALPLPNQSADIISIAFGIRNVSDWGKAIDEFARVLKPGGRLIILEFSLPTNPLLRAFYNFYFRKIMPHTATLISGDKSGAYKYLPESVNTFISRDTMQKRMQQASFTSTIAKPLTFGICVCYKGIKM
ncbi:MAG TPA: bifunctional demethylmenaquinone methyltransferase/2-methoxy-6-polyprenyl-1,4-benzoquinol methylase UbiE [Phycisphaerae bacterium]